MKQVVYIGGPENQKIYIWKLNNLGKLTFLQTVHVPGFVKSMVIHRNNRYLYVGVCPLFSIISYYIQNNGMLKESCISSIPASPSYMSTDFLGRYLFSVSYSGNCISVSHIYHNGVVLQPIQQKINDLITPHSANIDLENKCLFVPCLKEDRIRLFRLSLDGQLTPHEKEAIYTASGSGPRHMVFNTNGKYAYCVNELNGTVDVLAILVGGSKYSIVQTLDIMPVGFSGTQWASDIHITPNGKFLYTSERTTSTITIIGVSKDGSRLSVIDYSPTAIQPRGFNIDHTGRFLISASQKSNYIVVYEINQSNGKLNSIGHYQVGKGPVWVSILAQK